MARSSPMRRVTQRFYLTHRGGGANQDAGNFSGYFAAVPGGKADIAFTVVNGVVHAPVPPNNRDLEPFDYTVGTFSLGDGGFGWAGPAAVTTPHVAVAGLEAFASYATGAVTGLDGGSGWADSALLVVY